MATPRSRDASDLAVVIPTRQRSAILARTLVALKGQTVTGFETVVVFDGADQATRVPPGMRSVVVDQAGPAAARNAGVAATDRPLVLFLGDDMVPAPDLVARHLDRHRLRPGVEVAVLGQAVWHPEVANSRLARWLDWSHTQFDYRNISGEQAGFGRFYSCNVSLATELLTRAGGFDEDFRYYYEDLDCGWRLAQQGMRLSYQPAALALHLHHYDWDGLARRFAGIGEGEHMMAAKHAWFRPFFAQRVAAAQAAGPRSALWPRIVDLVPEEAGQWRRRAEWRADTWYYRALAPSFLTGWETAAEKERTTRAGAPTARQ